MNLKSLIIGIILLLFSIWSLFYLSSNYKIQAAQWNEIINENNI